MAEQSFVTKLHVVLPPQSINQQAFIEWLFIIPGYETLIWTVPPFQMDSHNPFPDESGPWLGSAPKTPGAWLLVMCCCLEPTWLVVCGSRGGIACGIRRHYPFGSWHRLLCLDVGLSRISMLVQWDIFIASIRNLVSGTLLLKGSAKGLGRQCWAVGMLE